MALTGPSRNIRTSCRWTRIIKHFHLHTSLVGLVSREHQIQAVKYRISFRWTHPSTISKERPWRLAYRRLVSGSRNPIRGRVIEILDSLPRYEEFDWVERVAVELTGRMLVTILGVPQKTGELLIGWSNAISNADDPDYVSASGGFYETLAELGEYIEPIWKLKKMGPVRIWILALLANSPEGSTCRSRRS